MAEPTIQDAIEKAAITGVASATIDGQSATQMSVADMILADNYRAMQAAKNRNHLGLTFRRMEPRGCG